jgi:hypothetical protein
MRKIASGIAIISLLIVSITSCNPTEVGVEISPLEIETSMAQSVAETITAFVMSAQPISSETTTPSVAQSSSPSPTPQKVTGIVLENILCRNGPEKAYDLVGYLHPGDQIEMLARASDNSAWYIPMPGDTQSFCWVSTAFISVSGDPELLPVYTPMPSPTPKPPDFSIKYVGFGKCYQGGQFRLNLNIINTGSTIWELMLVNMSDTVSGEKYSWEEKEFRLNNFPCEHHRIFSEELLKRGIALFESPGLDQDLTGHLVLIEITLCEDKIDRYPCLTRTIKVTP